MIPYGRQIVSTEDIDAVVDVLRSDYLTQGPKVPEFESALCNYAGAEYACAVNSATSALHVSCLALGVGVGDIVWTSPITFVATANCALYCGATVDFVDIDSQTYNMSVVRLSEKLEEAESTGRLPKVVIPVHMCGSSCDMREIRRLADRYEFSIIEDASHAVGGSYRGRHIGGCEYADIAVFSFHPVKIITTAEGGAALTNRADLARELRLLRSHGITRDADQMEANEVGPWYYEQIALGFNYRMTDIQAALGLTQIKRVDQYVSRRNELANRYDRLLEGLPLTVPKHDELGESARHLYVIQLDDSLLSSRGRIFNDMRTDGIGVNVHYIPVHMQPYFRRFGFRKGAFPQAERYYRKAISIPLHPGLTEEQQDSVVASLKSAIANVATS